MKFFNENGAWKKVSVVIGTIAALFTFYWQFNDRVDARIIEAVKITEHKFVSSLDKFQRQQDVRYWMQLRDMARIELQRIARGLAHHPNDPGLLSERDYWQEVYDRAARELDKILNP